MVKKMQYKVDIVSLFDTTGYAVAHFTQMGYKTLIVDILNKKDNPKATYTLNWDILKYENELKNIVNNAKLLIGFPPCTDLAVSGAAHFKKKRLNNPKFQIEALHLFKSVVRIAENIPYMIENPVSVVSSMWRKPNFIFSPYEYGGYLPEDDIHPDFPEYILPRDAYNKKTCIWSGNGFVQPIKKPVNKPEGYSLQHRKLGGKSAKTKMIRSASPRGFFIALAQQFNNERRNK